MAQLQQDQFIDDDEEETCPLCIEELDLSDRNFRPCVCGYQICQFCYNNIKNQGGGRCPACRREYNDATIEWKSIGPEEVARYKANQANKAKKQAAAKQKEAQKREADSLKRAHLAGLRVVQKNLVYVTGLNPKVQEQQLLDTLRGDQYFGQYGKIIKIVVSKAKQATNPPQSVGVYVTFERKEDAAACIAAVDGSPNGDRTLRAQFGTTKYCSAYLRGDLCQNRNCMFLHEAAEENDSFTRHDLSSMNAASSQRPPGPSGAPPRQSQPPPQSQQPVSAASQPMQRDTSGDGISSPSSSAADHPGLPSSASWANRALQSSRRGSVATGSSNPSPLVSKAEPTVSAAAAEPPKPAEPVSAAPGSLSDSQPPIPVKARAASSKASSSIQRSPFDQLMKALNNSDFGFKFTATSLSKEDLNIVMNMPPLFDPNGGAKRRKAKEQEAERRRQLAAAQATAHGTVAADAEEATEAVGGSLQLGGEPEERAGLGLAQQHTSSQLPPQFTTQHTLGGLSEEISNLSLARGLTPQQQQHQLQLQQLRSVNPQSANLLSNLQQPGFQSGQTSGHARGQSRFSFANDNGSASASIKPVANAKLMSQQSSMMPQQTGAPFNQMSSQFGQNFNSGMPGPPPGLKQTGTPPMSGPQRFGQGIGFGGDNNRLAYGAGGQEALLRDMMHGQRAAASQVSDASKREYNLSSLLHHSHQQSHQQYPSTSTTPASVGPAPGHNLLGFPYGGPPASGYADSVASSQKQKKKGKKHRHANTSSSGGGVVNDLADPSILQARLQQQHGNITGGQAGLYGAGAGQGAGVPDDPFTAQRRPQQPSDRQSDKEQDATFDPKGPIRRPTPTVPPGFDKPDPTPAEAAAAEASKQKVVSKSRAASMATVTPALPSLAPVRIGTPLKNELLPSKSDGDAEAQHRRKMGSGGELHSTEALSPAPISDPDLTVPKTRANVSHPKQQTQHSDKLADAPKRPDAVPAITVPSGASKTAEASTVKSKATASTSSKRQAPGKLDIGAATGTLNASAGDDNAASSKPTTIGKDSRPVTPAAVSTGSPIKRNVAPRTLRLVSTPKSEMPPPLSTGAGAVSAAATAITAGPSRKGSIASINMPGTPSQDVSDSVSITSTSLSMSRASSPPPAKKTKSQVMRERKEKAAAKLANTEEVVLKKEEPVIAPIIGRKKKEKKAKDKGPVAAVKKEESRPAMPEPEVAAKADSDASPLVNSPAGHMEPLHLGHSAQADTVDSPVSDQLEEKRYISAATALKDLQARGELDIASLEMLRANPAAVSSQMRHDSRVRFDGNDFANALKLPDPFNEEAESKFADHEIVKWVEGQHTDRLSARNLVTPAGTWLKMLSADEEARYLAHEERLRTESDNVGLWQRTGIDEKLAQLIAANSSLPNVRRFYDSTFDPDQFTQHLDGPVEASSILPAAADRPTPLLPSANEPVPMAPSMSATGKVPSADEALQYVNQYVLPTVSLPHPQTSKAADAIYLGSAMPSKNRYNTGTAQAPGFIVEDSSYRFVGVGGEPALVGSVGPTSTSATLSAAAASAASRTQAAGYVGVGQGPGTVDAWTAVHRLTSARGMGKVRGYSDWYEGCPVPELGWSGRLFANVAEMERALQESKRETEGLEKRLLGVVKKNRRLVGLEKGGSGVIAH